ncbi:MAG: hypothetical protein HOK21_03280 [Rhodospirillaceae bacterium]|nr:hypothetical protein [Rhodospirillaceae bacterium]MBT5079494.1 hypothetical protein [Rhodospirillaceae bacterium]MBT5523083.1 hypothetical protein [Rhodospirillaceae bacterium]MBT5881483.1 hypothetical protein [Rhodospirillaceae bacterium]MBT6588061.1 hypothetical protein [Rhodospirillaceae bacterium]
MLAYFLVLIFIFVIFTSNRWTFDGITYTLLSGAFVAIGYAQIDDNNATSIWFVYFSSLVAFWASYHFSEKYLFHWVSRYDQEQIRQPFTNGAALNLCSIVVFSLAFYHVAAIGFPLFSDNIETARFNFGGSGLLGLPSRMWLFGMTLMIFAQWNYAINNPSYKNSMVMMFFTAAFVVLTLLGGFKGAPVYVAVLYLTHRLLAGAPVPIRSFLSYRFLAVAVFMVAFLFVLSGRYQSLDLIGYYDIGEYVVNRFTVIPAMSGYTLYTENVISSLSGIDFLVNDFLYFLSKYMNLNVSIEYGLSPTEYYTFVNLWNLDPWKLQPQAFAITMSYPAETYNMFGWVGSILLCAGLGVVLSWCVGIARRSNIGAFPYGIMGLVISSLSTLYSNGNIAYLIINISATIGFICLVYMLCISLVGSNRFRYLDNVRSDDSII